MYHSYSEQLGSAAILTSSKQLGSAGVLNLSEQLGSAGGILSSRLSLCSRPNSARSEVAAGIEFPGASNLGNYFSYTGLSQAIEHYLLTSLGSSRNTVPLPAQSSCSWSAQAERVGSKVGMALLPD